MENEKRTPNELKLCGADRGGCQCLQIWDGEGIALVAVALRAEDENYTGGNGYTLEGAKDNAAEIVLRYNSHESLKAQRDELVKALNVIEFAINDGDGGSYWPSRKFLDDRGVFNGDLNDLRVLSAVARAALSKVTP